MPLYRNPRRKLATRCFSLSGTNVTVSEWHPLTGRRGTEMNELMEMAPRFTLPGWIGLAMLGLSVGSFLNVVIYRLPVSILRGEPDPATPFSLLFPPSHCTSCQALLCWYDTLPLLSWALLKGKCRCCRQPVSMQYPLVEVSSLALSLLAGLFYPPGISLLGILIFSWLLLALSVIDINTFLLPDSLTFTLLWTGLFFSLNGFFAALTDAVAGAIVGYVTLRVFCELGKRVFHRACMGYGDCKLLAGLAAWSGWQHLPVLLLLASLMGFVWLAVARLCGKNVPGAPVPFGPSLSVAGWLVIILSPG